MNNYRQLMQEGREINKGNRTPSIKAKKYGTRSRVQAKQKFTNKTTHMSGSTSAWNDAQDVETSYEDMEAAFWS